MKGRPVQVGDVLLVALPEHAPPEKPIEAPVLEPEPEPEKPVEVEPKSEDQDKDEKGISFFE